MTKTRTYPTSECLAPLVARARRTLRTRSLGNGGESRARYVHERVQMFTRTAKPAFYIFVFVLFYAHTRTLFFSLSPSVSMSKDRRMTDISDITHRYLPRECGERERDQGASRTRSRARAHLAYVHPPPTHTPSSARARAARSVWRGRGWARGRRETADLDGRETPSRSPPSSPWRHCALRTRTLRPYPRVTRRDTGAHGCRVPSDSRTCQLRSSAVRAAGTVGSVTPIIESLVTSSASSAPLHPSVPLGRSGSTR